MFIRTLQLSADYTVSKPRLRMALQQCQIRTTQPSDVFYGLHIQLEL